VVVPEAPEDTLLLDAGRYGRPTPKGIQHHVCERVSGGRSDSYDSGCHGRGDSYGNGRSGRNERRAHTISVDWCLLNLLLLRIELVSVVLDEFLVERRLHLVCVQYTEHQPWSVQEQRIEPRKRLGHARQTVARQTGQPNNRLGLALLL
jgi:hypothetical protein